MKLVDDTGNRIEISHRYVVPHDQPWFEDEITVANPSHHPLALPDGRCGLVLPVKVAGNAVESSLRDFKFTAFPYRREPTGNSTHYADYTLLQVLTESRHSQLRARFGVRHWGKEVVAPVYAKGIVHIIYPQYASEGWVFTDGQRGFLITKYSADGMEWALLDRVPLGDERIGLRWGGSPSSRAIRRGAPGFRRSHRIGSAPRASPPSRVG